VGDIDDHAGADDGDRTAVLRRHADLGGVGDRTRRSSIAGLRRDAVELRRRATEDARAVGGSRSLRRRSVSRNTLT
jgi:hypothetical protein